MWSWSNVNKKHATDGCWDRCLNFVLIEKKCVNYSCPLVSVYTVNIRCIAIAIEIFDISMSFCVFSVKWWRYYRVKTPSLSFSSGFSPRQSASRIFFRRRRPKHKFGGDSASRIFFRRRRLTGKKSRGGGDGGGLGVWLQQFMAYKTLSRSSLLASWIYFLIFVVITQHRTSDGCLL